MLFRSLYIKLLLVSAFVLGGLWWYSVRNYSECTISPHISNFTLSASLYSATISLELNPHDQFRYQFQSSSRQASSLHESIRNQYGFMGKFDLGLVPTRGIGEAPGHHNYYLKLPLWFTYILVIGISFLLVKFLMRHSFTNHEK